MTSIDAFYCAQALTALAMADETAIPVRVGHYDLVRTIGKGNFAVVKLGRHSVTNAKVAVKVISTRALDSDQLRKLHREIDIMKRVQHKHVVRLYQVMQSERHVMLVTEFCAGGEIFDQLVANGRMSEAVARDYFHQIAEAVDFLHAHGIVHRDLKAENLLLSADLKRVKLADFGFSNYFSRDALLSTWCGSPPYAAPELFEGRHYSGPKADVWSLGVVLYVLVCGALPFDGHTLQSLKARVLAGKFRIPYFMSCDCEHLIRHMLVTDPEKRFSLSQVRSHRWMRASNPCCSEEPQLNDVIDMSIVEWVSRELSVDSLEVMESIRSRHFDHNYALYHLVRDSSHAPPSSAPPSPPLLPLLPATAQRKSSITTGVVERENNPSLAPLSAGVSPLRRHTFGPDTQGEQLVTPPLLFLTPPTAPPPPLASLPLAPPNYPIANTELLRPPNVLLINNNMGRRASDGQANYSRPPALASSPVSASAFNFPLAQTSPPISAPKARQKRHSLTDANDLVSRQRRSGLSSVSTNNDRSRRRASDGSTVGSSPQQISISSLQTELRALCVSSPPSLQSSPQHSSASPTQSLPPSSPPPVLPLISEEHQSAHTVSPVPLLTPPQSFRSSPVTSPVAPSIALTDELGAQFPILPPPESFTVSSTSNLERGVQEEPRLHRWRDERRHFAATDRALRQTYPPSVSHLVSHSTAHYTSLQCLKDSRDKPLTTTGSGSICVDSSAASRLLRRLALAADAKNVLTFDNNDLQICFEWNALRQQLVLRRVSGDQNEYAFVCSQLIHSVM